MGPAAILNILVTANTAQANTALAGTQKQMMGASATATKSGAVMKKAFLGIGLVAAGAGVALFKVGEEFDDAFDKISTRTGATGREMQKLKGVFRDVVSDVPASFEDASTAVGDLNTRLGLSGKPLAKMSKQMTELSRITETDVSGNIEAVSKAFVDWEVKTKNQSKTLDGFFRLSQESGLAVADIASSVQKFGSPLRQLGIDLDTAAAMFANFERSGVNTATMVPGLKLALANLNAPIGEAEKQLKAFNITIGNAPKGLQEVFAVLGDDNIKAVDRISLAMATFGRRAGADMKEAIEQGRFEVEKYLKVMESGEGTIIDQGRRTMDLSEQWQKFSNMLKVEIEPVARKVFKGLGDLMKEVTTTFKKEGLQGVLDLLQQKFSEAVPKIAEAGVKLAGALLKGLLDAGVWGKLAAGALVYKMLGGLAAFKTAGTVAGTTLAGRLGAGLKLGLARTGIGAVLIAGFEAATTSGGVLDTIKGEGATWGRDFATSIAETFGPKLEKAIQNRSLPALRRMNGAIQAYTEQWSEMFGELPPGMTAMADKGERAFDRLQAEMDRTKDKINDLKVTWHGGMRSILRDTDDNMRKIKESFGSNSQRGKELLSDNFNAAIDAIRAAMDAGKIATERGLQKIQDILGRQLKLFGVKPQDVFDATTRSTSGDSMPKGGHWTGQRGGPIDMGAPVGDSVPAMLERGEYVLNRKAVSTVGKGVLDKINFGFAKRFQSGGGVGMQPGISKLADVLGSRFGMTLTSGYRAGDDGFHGQGLAGDFAGGSWRGASRYVNSIGASLLEGIYNPAVFGGTPVSWDSGSPVSSGFWGSDWAAHQDHIHAAIAGALGARTPGAAGAPAKLKLPRFSSSFPAGAVAAGGLNLNAATLEKVIGERVNARTAGGAFSGFTGGRWTGVMRKIAQSRGWSFGDWMKLVQGESGGNPEATNPSSGAFGLGQFLGSTLDAYRPYGAASHDPVKQIQAMAKYISDRYGTPSSAYSTWLGRSPHWYQKGGAVPFLGSFHKGGVASQEGLAHVEKGEAMVPLQRLAGGGNAGRNRRNRPGRGSVTWGSGLGNSRGVFRPDLSYEDHLTLNNIAMTAAQATAGREDDIAALGRRADMVGGRTLWLQQQLARPGLSAQRRTDLLQQLDSATSEQASIQQSIVDLQTATDEGTDALQANTDALNAQAEALKAVQAELAEQNGLVRAAGSSDRYQALAALADLLSGQIGGQITAIGHTAGAGSVRRS